jgi:ketosteroid isomerase-like protein
LRDRELKREERSERMSAVEDVDEIIERYQMGLDEFMKGDPEPVKGLFSHTEDVTLANPLGPPAHGWEQVSATIEHAASQFRDGRLVSAEIVQKWVTAELAYTVWLEHAEGKVGAREDVAPSTLRVTMIYRPEEGEWKVVHRHADPITTPRPAETVIQE